MLVDEYDFSEQNSVDTIRKLISVYPELDGHAEKFYVVTTTYNTLTKYPIEEYKTFLYKKILEGKKIIFDVSAETILTNLYQYIHEIIEDIDVEDGSFFCLCGAIDGEAAYQKFRVKYNYKKNIQVICFHQFEYFMRNTHSKVNEPQFDIKPKEKLFLCFNKIERYQRVYLYAHSIKYGWFDKSFYSFEGSIPEFIDKKILFSDSYLNKEFCYPYLEEWVKEVLEQTKYKFPIRLNITEERKNPLDVNQEDMYFFENSYLSIVTETLFYKVTNKNNGLCVFNYEPAYKFITEKTFKPIIAKHPFISVGFTGILQLLKNRGYKTFHPYIDETYDNIQDDYERLKYITNEIVRLSNFSENEWIEWQKNVKDIVEYNYNHFFDDNKDYRHTRWNDNWIK